MTIPASTRKSGPFKWTGGALSFPFNFKVDAAADVLVLVTNAAGVEQAAVLNSDYTVVLSADQRVSPGGTVLYINSGANPLPLNGALTILGGTSFEQPTDLPDGGLFNPSVIEAAMDRLAVLTQQLDERTERAVLLPATSTIDSTELAALVVALGGSFEAMQTLAPRAADLGALGPRAADLGALGPHATDIGALGPHATDIGALGPHAADIGTVAGIKDEVLAAPSYAQAAKDWATKIGGEVIAGQGFSAKQYAANAAASAASVDLSNLARKDGSNATGTWPFFHAFLKANPQSVAFTKTGAATATTSQQLYVEVSGVVIPFAPGTAIVMPALAAGTDYAIYACSDGTLRADSSFTAPAGYTTANSRQIGGFHYAPGSNAAARAGGDTTPQINPYSFWDLKFRPACADPRGMVLVAGNFWADIYLTGVDHIINGTSKYNVTIADGSSPPKVPLEFGGNGSLAYGSMTWWEAAEVARAHGKQLPTYDQFAALAFGTTEAAASGGTDVPTTGQTGTGATTAWNALTSKWGVIQSTGCLWTWGREFAAAPGVAGPYNWFAETSGRGSIYEFGAQSIVAALFGASWSYGSNAGSRASFWSYAPSLFGSSIGLRCVVPHQVLV